MPRNLNVPYVVQSCRRNHLSQGQLSVRCRHGNRLCQSIGATRLRSLVDALAAAGIETVFSDKKSGATTGLLLDDRDAPCLHRLPALPVDHRTEGRFGRPDHFDALLTWHEYGRQRRHQDASVPPDNYYGCRPVSLPPCRQRGLLRPPGTFTGHYFQRCRSSAFHIYMEGPCIRRHRTIPARKAA
jgi:hypothetical protein